MCSMHYKRCRVHGDPKMNVSPTTSKPSTIAPGQQFGAWAVVSRAPAAKGRADWICRCLCGTVKPVQAHKLRIGTSQSCGCQIGKRARPDGFRRPIAKNYREYTTWCSMRERCENPARPSYRYYGGRGITVCEAWASFNQFLSDMGPRPEGTSLDRVDPDGPYSPGNCRWADQATQNANRRRPVCTKPAGRLNADAVREIRRLHTQGATKREMGDRFGVHYTTIAAVITGKSWSNVP